MNNLLKYMIIGLVILLSVVALSLCAEGVGDGCAHSCCVGGDRSRPLTRLARRLTGLCSTAFSFGLVLFALASRSIFSAVASFVPTPDLLRMSSLRI